MADKAPLTVTITTGAERRVWCDKHFVSEAEVDVLMLSSTGFRKVGTHRDCDEGTPSRSPL